MIVLDSFQVAEACEKLAIALAEAKDEQGLRLALRFDTHTVRRAIIIAAMIAADDTHVRTNDETGLSGLFKMPSRSRP